jgi:protein involved in polysaccharide export with SLBB domain
VSRLALRWLVLLGLATGLPSPVAAQAPSTSLEEAAREAASAAARATSEEAAPGSASVRGSVPIPGAVDDTLYRVGPGDVLQLHLWGRVTQSRSIDVGPEGTVLLPGGGSLHVAGLSLAEARSAIMRTLATQYRGVTMDIRLERLRAFRVYLTGRVKSGGAVLANGTTRVADVITPDNLEEDASMRRIEVIRRDGSRAQADVGRFLRTGEAELNPWLRDGDVVHVPVATEFVHVQGAVATPGRFELGFRDSMRTLLRMAGDPLPAASLDRALWIRWKAPYASESLVVNLEDVYAGRVNYPSADGERVYVYFVPQYHLQHEASIVGEVRQPGTYPIVEGLTRLSDLLTSASGFLPTADLSSIRVRRANPASDERDPELERLLRLSRNELTGSEYEKLRTTLAGLREDYRVDWNRMQENPTARDLLLRNGDIVRVERLVSSIRVDGEVQRPAILTYKPGQSLDAYIREAGGFTDRAWRGKVRVTRAVTGQTLPARNVRALDPGDFVWVPERPDRTAWEQMTMVLTALAQVATIVIAIESVNNR